MFTNKKDNMDSNKNSVKINFVEPNTKIIGEIESKSDFRIDGVLEGKINTSGRVVIGNEGSVKVIYNVHMLILWEALMENFQSMVS